MMKSLSTIKQLRIEIGKFQKTAQSSVTHRQDSILGAHSSARDQLMQDDPCDKVQQSCFGCIHAYLQALLNFIVLTSKTSEKICEEFAKKR